MKLVRFNMEGTQQRVWVLQHDLASRVGPIQKTRPLHLLTFVYGTLPGNALPKHAKAISRPCLALEAKLKAITHFGVTVKAAFSNVPQPGLDGGDVASFDAGMVVIAEVEAYLGAVYTSLELTNTIVRLLRPGVKQGFRDMAKKGVAPFTFERWPWLGSFYDVRTELCHFGSSLPMVQRAAIVLDITQNHKTHRFQHGTQVAVPLAELLGYEDDLRAMLDEWALEHLGSLDPELTLYQLVFDSDGRRQGVRPTLRELMATHL
jgi:hypothetical protein